MPSSIPDFKSIKLVKKYRGQNPPLSYRTIARKMKKDVKTVYRWKTYIDKGVLEKEKLSTVKSK